jgi:SNF2 family DNA or RNA helicase
MKLMTGKKSGFRIYYKGSEDVSLIEAIPTSRHYVTRQTITLADTVEVWKQLKKIENLSISKPALDRMSELADEYIANRINLRKANRKFKHTGKVQLPVPLKTDPFQHQVKAFGFHTSVDSSALFAEQGTGKTLVAIAVAGHRFLKKEVTTVLVGCPKSVVYVWRKELRKHADFTFRFIPRGAGKLKEGVLNFVVYNYDMLTRQHKKIMKKFKPDMMILDEGHKIKNGQAKISKTCHKMAKQIPYRLLMTGTPIGQGVEDIHSEIKFIDESIFGSSFSDFRDQYLEMGGYMGYEIIGYKNEEKLLEKLHTISFRVTKKECLDLPPELSQNLYVEPDRITKKLYKKIEDELGFVHNGEPVEAELPVTKLMKLRQITGGIVKSDLDSLVHISNAKLEVLREYIRCKNWKKKLVIFTSFTHETDSIGNICKKEGRGYLVLDGRTTDKIRNNIEDLFNQDKRFDIIIVQVQTGGEGLDFTSADVGIFYSPTFSYIWTEQCKARLHRNNQDSPVTYLYMVMLGTVDEYVVEVLEESRSTANSFLDERRNYQIGGNRNASKKESKFRNSRRSS